MFAVLRTGGKQYKVKPGDMLRVEKLDAAEGDKIKLDDILMLGGAKVVMGTPRVDGAAVVAEVMAQIKGKKVIHFVRRRRKHSSKRTKGHRQNLTVLRITDILTSGASELVLEKADPQEAVTETQAAPSEARSTKSAQPQAAPADDLKKLSGVGPALERKLHGAGVTTFAQIAAWTDADVAAMDAQLSFKGRIEREGWIDQAKAALAESEGE